MTFPYTDGLLEAKEALPGWIAINWLYPGKKRFTALKTLAKIEKAVKEQGFKGWLAYSEYQYTTMHKILLRFGCFPYAGDSQNIYFKKEVN